MPLILNIETATDVCSVCLSQNGGVLALREDAPTQDHAARITLMISSCFEETGLPMTALDAVAVSDGPGSYTSLRIGLATAKGICYALDKPLIAIGTLDAIAWAALADLPAADICVPMIDARRMEVYWQVFDRKNQPLREPEACILHPGLFEPWLQSGQSIVCAGTGSNKAQSLLA
ncbi:MAG: tRNA (adenosine(37)-N6)-threonylcarbamoyltransferase complex dimerization subunit type 1 TsaB, partial [Saprospiraceae bacterium]|nr:tRNA (adenosine(37)-N6)-threonylcarbamoyltransferase complex dimerization subunit type 1 TsaB [Saprospiraceae bacterium]